MASGPNPTIPISQADDIVWNNTKEIIALKEYTDRYISLYQGEIRNIGYELANRLIAKGIVAEHDETGSGGGSSSSSGGDSVNIVYLAYKDEDLNEELTYSVLTSKPYYNEQIYDYEWDPSVEITGSDLYNLFQTGKPVFLFTDNGHQILLSAAYTTEGQFKFSGIYPQYILNNLNLYGIKLQYLNNQWTYSNGIIQQQSSGVN